MRWCAFLLVFGAFFCVDAYKILVVYPFPVKSLSILGTGFVKHLLDAGHDVTFVTSFPIKNSSSKLRQVDISSNAMHFDDITANKLYLSMTKILKSTHKILKYANDDGVSIKSVMDNEIQINDVKMLQEYALTNAITTFIDKNFQELLQDVTQTFDAVIVDLYETEIYAGLAHLYGCPMIWATSMGPSWQVLRLIDEPSNPAYTADYLSANIVPFTLQQRLEELWAQIKWSWVKATSTLPKEKEAYQKIFKPLFDKRGKALPDYNDVMYAVSLMFANEHHAMGGLPKTPQNFKMVGGYHIDHPPKPLPQDLQSLLDNAKHGVIYFSMGTTWSSKGLPKSIIEGLLKLFGKLQQTVIWKFEADLPRLPANVKIVTWAPQPSILAHPNLVIFITHGGLLSSTEAVHFGVPIIGIPIFFDQFVNINKAAAKGYAIRVPLNYELPDNLEGAIRTMLSDPKYKKKAKDLSSVYHDRPVPPGKEVVHWVEHVIRTKGASHLKSPALSLPFYQKYYLDLVAIVFAIVFSLIKTIKMCLPKRNVLKKKEKKN